MTDRVREHLAFLLTDLHDRRLAPDHLADLRASGLSDETIRNHRIRSVPPAEIAQLLGFDIPTIRSAMLIPFADPNGGFMDHVRLKIFLPFKDRNGNTVKYLQPRRSGVRLFFTLARLGEALKKSTPLWLVEGEKKALAVAQLGLPAIGFCGIEGWHTAGSRDLLADFDHVQLNGRLVELLPDGDCQTNVNVRRSALRFAEALEARSARVRIVKLPAQANV
jgi:putative DNA primase/helicase